MIIKRWQELKRGDGSPRPLQLISARWLGIYLFCWGVLSNPLLAADPPAPRFDYAASLKISQAAVGHTVRDRTLTDTSGHTVHLHDLLGKPLIISMVYTSCYQICAMTTRNLAKVVDKARNALGKDSFRVLTIGFDTRFDTPEHMRHFANQQGVNAPDWFFLSIDRSELDPLKEDIGFLFFPSPQGFDHLIQATILDSQGQVYRQIYGDAYNASQVVEPLKQLILGTPQPNQTVVEDLVRRVRFFCTVYDPFRDSYRFDYSLFLGLGIGGSIIGLGLFIVFRELRRAKQV